MTYLLPSGPKEGGFSNSAFARWFVDFDENKLRPFLIKDYTIENALLQDAINDLITKDFDDKNPEALEKHIGEINQKTR